MGDVAVGPITEVGGRHSITSLARPRSGNGSVMPRALALFVLMISADGHLLDREITGLFALKNPARIELTSKACEYFKRGIDVFWRMVGADLKPDLLVALRNHRIIQTGGENAILVEMSDYRLRALGITEHQWYNRVLPGECLEAKPNQASLETHCHRVKVIEQCPPDRAI